MLTIEAFKSAGMATGLRCVTNGEDALKYVRREGQYWSTVVTFCPKPKA